ncbi:MAG: TGS domain-containing protein [Bacteroidales bacterium]|nr:TGS domain-containing protein [Bacteroidales bacterium]
MNTTDFKQKLFSIDSIYIDEQRKEIISNIADYLSDFYSTNYNYLGVNYFNETYYVSEIILTKIGIGFSGILTEILFRAYEAKLIDEQKILELIPNQFAEQVIILLNGLNIVNKLEDEPVFGISKFDFENKASIMSKRSKKFAQSIEEYLTEQGEYFKHFYIAMGKDIRVILLKLAFHYYKVLNIKDLPEHKQKITSTEARYLYAPMAHQLGLYNVKTLLEETAMKYLNADVYQYIAKVLDETKTNRDKYISDFIKPIKKSIEELNFDAQIKGRPKSIHSIWKKMKKQNVGLDKIYDLFAVRIVLKNDFKNLQDEKSACWNVYSKLTDIWTPNPKRLKDWVSAPKTSGYESLHTTVIGPEGKWVEVQIRTQRMDEIAEKGSAAHWKYKEIKGQQGHEQWLIQLRQVLENPELQDTNSEVKKELYSDTLFVYTPAGELKKLHGGATVLDFAYKLHSHLGNSCIGGKINGKHVGIKHKITNGDIVEIVISKNQRPKHEWLDIVVSRHAKTRITRALKLLTQEKINQGKEKLIAIFDLTKQKYKKHDFAFDDKKLNQLLKKFAYSKINDFYLDYNDEKFSISEQLLYEMFVENTENNYENVIKRLNEQISTKLEEKPISNDLLLIDKNVSGIKYELAKCCNPIPGDDIFAFVSATSGTKIHKITCSNARELFTKYSYRVMRAAWKDVQTKQRFKAKLKIVSEQKPGIVAKISQIILNEPFIELYDININESKNETYEGTIGVLVNSTIFINNLIKKLKAISGILLVQRIENI